MTPFIKLTKHIVFWGLCAVLVFVPLPIGSVEEWAVFVFEAATIGLFLVYLGGEITRNFQIDKSALFLSHFCPFSD